MLTKKILIMTSGQYFAAMFVLMVVGASILVENINVLPTGSFVILAGCFVALLVLAIRIHIIAHDTSFDDVMSKGNQELQRDALLEEAKAYLYGGQRKTALRRYLHLVTLAWFHNVKVGNPARLPEKNPAALLSRLGIKDTAPERFPGTHANLVI